MNIFIKLAMGLFKGSIEKVAEQKAGEWLDKLHDSTPDIHAAVLHVLNDAVGRLKPLAVKTETEFDDLAIEEIEQILASQANKYGIALGASDPLKKPDNESDPNGPHGTGPGGNP